MVHDLKISSAYFDAVANGIKTFEVRRKDRMFSVGDSLLLREFSEGQYTGRAIQKAVTYILDNDFCVDGYVILALKGE